ncbi:MAG: tetratricopeptide repeat protein, partial [Deltaproteobacteria bacterium]|nr:tetratricopeptide repeat protein [Deltaproteobacteria bacterium]
MHKINKIKSIGKVVLFLAFIFWTAPILAQDSDQKNVEDLDQQIIELFQQGRLNEAIPLAREALEIRTKSLGPEHPETAANMETLGELFDS